VADLDLALVFTPDPWVEELHRHLADHGGARVLHLVVDPAMALHEPFDVLVVSWRWAALTPGFVAELHALGRSVLGVADRDERGSVDMLTGCGVDAVVHSDAAPWDYVDALTTIAAARPEREAPSVPLADSSSRRRTHPWIAVGGPAGAGRTEIALELARVTGAVLIDADAITPGVSARLGLALEPNLRTAIDAVEFGIGECVDAVQAVAGLSRGVLCGVPSSSAWSHVRPPELLRVVGALGTIAPLVVDVAAAIDDGDGGPARGPSSLARAVLAEADHVVAVGLASPLGVVRMLTWLAEAHRLRGRRPVHVVLNRGTGGAGRRAELAGELLRSYTPSSLTHVPDDERVRAAGWDGTLVGRGPFTKAVAATAGYLAASTDATAAAS
jgi:hypothetical protein